MSRDTEEMVTSCQALGIKVRRRTPGDMEMFLSHVMSSMPKNKYRVYDEHLGKFIIKVVLKEANLP